jgi:hypothetical protein
MCQRIGGIEVMNKVMVSILLGALLVGCGKSGGPPVANEKWGSCYNQAFIRNNPTASEVTDPVYAFLDAVCVRPEVLECSGEFREWIASNQDSSIEMDRVMAETLTPPVERGYIVDCITGEPLA